MRRVRPQAVNLSETLKRNRSVAVDYQPALARLKVILQTFAVKLQALNLRGIAGIFVNRQLDDRIFVVVSLAAERDRIAVDCPSRHSFGQVKLINFVRVFYFFVVAGCVLHAINALAVNQTTLRVGDYLIILVVGKYVAQLERIYRMFNQTFAAVAQILNRRVFSSIKHVSACRDEVIAAVKRSFKAVAIVADYRSQIDVRRQLHRAICERIARVDISNEFVEVGLAVERINSVAVFETLKRKCPVNFNLGAVFDCVDIFAARLLNRARRRCDSEKVRVLARVVFNFERRALLVVSVIADRVLESVLARVSRREIAARCLVKARGVHVARRVTAIVTIADCALKITDDRADLATAADFAFDKTIFNFAVVLSRYPAHFGITADVGINKIDIFNRAAACDPAE